MRNIWHFGNNAGHDFNLGAPSALTNGALVAVDNSASIADQNGNLLFYTEGINVCAFGTCTLEYINMPDAPKKNALQI